MLSKYTFIANLGLLQPSATELTYKLLYVPTIRYYAYICDYMTLVTNALM